MEVAVGVTGIRQYRAGMLMHLEMNKLSTFSKKKKIIWPHVSATCMLRNPEYNRVRTTKGINIVLLSQEAKQALFYHQVLFNISIIYLCLFSCFPPNWHNFP